MQCVQSRGGGSEGWIGTHILDHILCSVCSHVVVVQRLDWNSYLGSHTVQCVQSRGGCSEGWVITHILDHIMGSVGSKWWL